MNKEQFLAAIGERLDGLPQSDIDKSLDFYGEMIDDRIEDGLTEEQAVEAMGTADEIASQILMETPLPKLMKARARPDRALRVWEVILLALGSPIWASLLLAAACVFLAFYLVVWSFVVVLYAVDFSLAACGIFGLIGSGMFVFGGKYAQALLFFGAGLVCAGLAILAFFAFNQITLGVIRLSRLMVVRVKSLFIKKRGAK